MRNPLSETGRPPPGRLSNLLDPDRLVGHLLSPNSKKKVRVWRLGNPILRIACLLALLAPWGLEFRAEKANVRSKKKKKTRKKISLR
ncbi:uncharacterized protein BP01DRAFT_358848 [Aspergillus saccharolyticus JOP 1030-1]|uniref:Uncharacterized protein n=1 Tax=Aspergillus saccharolyticus JOP 1030-1 TaxID=1450539 RepID=A0A318Z9H1_9EURO|nr:hypothetical protein BP01DRAFT_358848 [Aspergillus saccharolyticus JOP 1030-1]PYH43067.1 hypothetical protein BP01DRAFT_358848 [Aspergillus saccharolyticus JOP 1030-1]